LADAARPAAAVPRSGVPISYTPAPPAHAEAATHTASATPPALCIAMRAHDALDWEPRDVIVARRSTGTPHDPPTVRRADWSAPNTS
jgi:hypothetical protein